MAFIPVPNTVQAEFIYSYQAQVMENVLYFEAITPPVALSDMLSLGATLVEWWQATLEGQMNTGLSLEKIALTDLTTETSLGIDYTVGLPSSGAVLTDPLPLTDAILVNFGTFVRGRSFRGRNYLPAIGEGQQSGGVVPEVTRDAIESLYMPALTTAVGDDWTWVVVSRYTDNAPRLVGLTTPITEVTTSRYIATQRRRRQGHGS